MNTVSPQIQEAPQTPSMKNINKTTPRHRIKLLNTSNKEKILKAD